MTYQLSSTERGKDQAHSYKLYMMVNYKSSLDARSEPWPSDETTSICQLVIFCVVCQSIDIFGVVSNVINAVCFIKQGFKDPVNVSLLGLALADLCCLVTLIWTNICYTLAISQIELPFEPVEFLYLTCGMAHAMFTRVTAWITAIIAIERCICIIAPLKVKGIVTSRRVTILIVSVFCVLLASGSPVYMVNKLGMKYYPHLNKTLLGLVTSNNRGGVEKITFTINNIIVPFGAFSVITMCTVTLATQLQKISKWRKKANVANNQIDNVSIRNQRVAGMVVMLSSTFIICFIPISFVFLTAIIEPQFAIDGKYKNVAIICLGFCFILESVNSSVNIFIYYHMSSKYRDTINAMFGIIS